jgi:hypothetical protein
LTDSFGSILQDLVRGGKSVDMSGHASGRRTTEDENGGRDASARVPTRRAVGIAPESVERFKTKVREMWRGTQRRTSTHYGFLVPTDQAAR